MIYESEFWKKDLKKQADFLGTLLKHRPWGSTTQGRLEQSIMLGFYAIRKLGEAHVLSDATLRQEIQLKAYLPTGKDVTYRNWDKVDELYEMENPSGVTKDLIFLCHQFVHSYVFMAVMKDRPQGLFGILFCSDRERHKNLYLIEADRIVALFRQCGNEYPNEIHTKFNASKRDYDFTIYFHTDSIHEDEGES